jgi:hypothetical protein
VEQYVLENIVLDALTAIISPEQWSLMAEPAPKHVRSESRMIYFTVVLDKIGK